MLEHRVQGGEVEERGRGGMERRRYKAEAVGGCEMV